jgi:hypothetical protein
MNQFNFNHLVIEYNEAHFSASSDGMIFYNEVPLTEAPWNDEHAQILKEIKNRLKAHKALEDKKLSERIDSLGVDIGKRYYSFQMDNRLYHAMKAKGLNMTKFINEAIAEKLTRDSK